jgi:hypothetical protein
MVTDSVSWEALTTPGYCYYKNMSNADSIKKFGALYNWYTVNTKKLAPLGWHIPDTTDWNILVNYLILIHIAPKRRGNPVIKDIFYSRACLKTLIKDSVFTNLMESSV